MGSKDESKITPDHQACPAAEIAEGDVYMSRDEAHLASLGYKQGIHYCRC